MWGDVGAHCGLRMRPTGSERAAMAGILWYKADGFRDRHIGLAAAAVARCAIERCWVRQEDLLSAIAGQA